ncbi:hypothetical protein RFI_02467 [Reticulomyxa filosa]|uniref:Carboxylesterase type B domain-containing protein n=1 Tax=Reticulomyxa filosa TaxID=46433 RepID=X6PAE9_RETFI|nr:hypothetical protein RFI_02467 [Reticulomyxa filosa]|eukprot:ETO34622.1 hypothetical protein RFI_02467 [Reticulomyxa filosa]
MLSKLSQLLLLAVFWHLNIVVGVTDDPAIVHINDGVIQGQIASGVRMFRKIPYASPPVGNFRWAPPEMPIPWNNQTLMVCNLPPHGCPTYTSEDCLYLNVFAPYTQSNTGQVYPVMVVIAVAHVIFFIICYTYMYKYVYTYVYICICIYIYYYQKNKNKKVYNASFVVRNFNVVVVTINYRLGALGFLWSLTGPSDKCLTIGNYGMLDQRLALEWVKDNIAYFGGDSNRITIYGQSVTCLFFSPSFRLFLPSPSIDLIVFLKLLCVVEKAGAMSVGLHMVQGNWQSVRKQGKIESDSGLFQGAIMESNPFGLPFRDTASWGTLPRKFYELIDCNYDKFSHNEELFWQCLRNVTVDDIVKAQWTAQNDPEDEVDHFWDIFLPWSPTCGTDLFPEQGFFEFQQGNYADIPYMIGVVQNESVEFVYSAFPTPVGRVEMELVTTILVGEQDAQLVYQQYPFPENTTDYRNWATVVVTDGLFRCPTSNTTAIHAQLHAQNKKTQPAFMYHFNHLPSFSPQLWGPNATYCWTSVCHADELPFVFHPNPIVDNTSYTQMEQYLILNMISYWTTFATTLASPGKGSDQVPSNATGVEWTVFDVDQQNCIIFNTGQLEMVNNYDTSVCEFWNALNYNWIK